MRNKDVNQEKFQQEARQYEKYDFLAVENLKSYLNSNYRKETLNRLNINDKKPNLILNKKYFSFNNINLVFANKIDLFISQFIQIQANILANTNVCVGLDNEFSRIKPTSPESAKYDCFLDYIRSKDFSNSIRNKGQISYIVPSDLMNYFESFYSRNRAAYD